MRQVLQSLKTGKIELIETPVPQPKRGCLLIRSRASLISTGTERMLLEFGEASLLNKARQQPEKVRMVLDKIKTDGLLPTLDAVRNKLETPLAMGYSSCGEVIDMGEGVTRFSIGDRVVSNGPHAEFVSVPMNLCAKVPEDVGDEAAAFTVVGSIALEGVRLANPTLGETFVVTGLGLIGLITVQLLRANGCRVIGIDLKESNLQLARDFGAETVDLSKDNDPVPTAMTASRGRGVDGVIITAVTSSDEPVHQAALMSRKRGRIVLVGVTGLKLSRADFYQKELSFQVSCSYGPGRYDKNYEEKGLDYPFGLVRWTEQRNFEAVLDLLAEGRLSVEPLISHRFDLREAERAYMTLKEEPVALGILLRYPKDETDPVSLKRKTVELTPDTGEPETASEPIVGFIGSGNYATRVLIPAFKKAGAHMESVASSGGVSGVNAGRKFGFRRTTTATEELFGDDRIRAIVVASMHNQHAQNACDSVNAGKHVFVEKPLATTRDDLKRVQEAYEKSRSQSPAPLLMVGFNRRFAPHTERIKQLLSGTSEPKTFIMTVNAGEMSPDHWMQDPVVGGGRIIGEGCHFIDLLRFLAGHPIISVHTDSLGSTRETPILSDKVSFSLRFADGSVGTIHYLANGHRAFPKERLEIFCDGRIIQLDNFRRLRAFGWPGFKKMNLFRQDKGQTRCVDAFVDAVRTGRVTPTPFDEVVEVTEVSFQVAEAAAR
jgi:predicted dehydrogenase/threonine dehydrogenase-like Zn-dependent dehydrogenase